MKILHPVILATPLDRFWLLIAHLAGIADAFVYICSLSTYETCLRAKVLFDWSEQDEDVKQLVRDIESSHDHY